MTAEQRLQQQLAKKLGLKSAQNKAAPKTSGEALQLDDELLEGDESARHSLQLCFGAAA